MLCKIWAIKGNLDIIWFGVGWGMGGGRGERHYD